MKVLVKSRIRRLRVDAKAVARCAEAVMRKMGAAADTELSVLFLGARGMRHLNRCYRNHDTETDVLAFPLARQRGCRTAASCMLGDVVVSVDEAQRNARRFGTTTDRELLLYLIHGILHLWGFDDTHARARATMHERQETMLRAMLRKGDWRIIRQRAVRIKP
ncbi:MAG: rRNA maturation RNase YbeY [Candidatus Aureabacteria bacterium]|nr:rRNA maturation RNase YbeY [Candidatus Auribacterota bacterium]